jgi:predicted nucleic acid-binding protein
LADTSVWARIDERPVALMLATAAQADVLATTPPVTLEILRAARSVSALRAEALRLDALRQVDLTREVGLRARLVQERLAARGYPRGPSPIDLLTAAAAESVDAELWHCDRHFELIADVTRQPVRRVGL